MKSFGEFVRSQVGPNWTVCRRTDRRVAQYGADAVFLSRKRYEALAREYEELTWRSRNGPVSRLIIPELLECCRESLKCIEKHVPKTEFAPRDRLRAAIAKTEAALKGDA